ncbi:MAG TPA: prephenate dehydratase [Ornithinicoccus sp.]|nr:prephenate dehydratase [Ornithinicoccus sp.]
MTGDTAGAPAIGYLGPAGTFTEEALRALHGEDVAAWPAPTVPAALDGVREGRLDAAVVPLENSVEGSVPATLDELVHGEPLQIRREAHVRVGFALLAREELPLDRVRTVATHPHAAAQTRRWLQEHLPQAQVVAEASTARAAELVAEGRHDAAVAAPRAAAHYGLVSLADGIADRPGAVTRFVEVARPGPPPPPTGADTTSLVVFIRRNRPGALLEVLEQFAVRGIDLSRLESRPTGEALGRYCFTVDAVGHVAEPRMGEALAGLWRTSAGVRFLGSYPRADRTVAQVPEEAGAAAYEAAQAWVESLRRDGGRSAP